MCWESSRHAPIVIGSVTNIGGIKGAILFITVNCEDSYKKINRGRKKQEFFQQRRHITTRIPNTTHIIG